MARKVLIDTDPGIDDSLALLLALRSPELDVVGVTTTFGNALVEQTTRNALTVLALAGRSEIPVAGGAARPMDRPYPGPRTTIHGEDGLGNTFLPMPAAHALDLPAPEFIVQMLRQSPGKVSLVTLGPLTNLALALRLEPRLARLARQVIVMGGAVFRPGNTTPVAEANMHHDPEAAARVLSAGLPLVMVGLDVTMKMVMTRAYLDDLAHAAPPLGDFIAGLVPVYLQAHRARYDLDGIFAHDPSALAYALEPRLFQVERLPVYVETEGRCAGQTVADRARQWVAALEVGVCVDVDAPRLLALIRQRLAA